MCRWVGGCVHVVLGEERCVISLVFFYYILLLFAGVVMMFATSANTNAATSLIFHTD